MTVTIVMFRGNIEYSTYNGKHQIRFVPTQVSLSSKEIDFDAEGFEERLVYSDRCVHWLPQER